MWLIVAHVCASLVLYHLVQVDIDYYLKSQVHPVVSRLLEPIEGTDNSMVRDILVCNHFKHAREPRRIVTTCTHILLLVLDGVFDRFAA